MAQTEFREYRNCVPRFLAPCGIRGQSNSRMNPPQFFAEMKRPNVSVLLDRKSTRLNSSHSQISYAVFCLKKKKKLFVRALRSGKRLSGLLFVLVHCIA